MTLANGWETRTLSALADYINGYAFKPDDWGKEGLPIIRIEQLKNPDGPADYYGGQLPPKVVIDDGDLIFSWSASLFLRIWTHGRAALNQHLFKVVEKGGVDRLFLKAFIEYYLPELTKASHGSTMQHITRKELDRFAAPFPKCELEQAKIAEVLSTVDRAIEQTEALIAKQQRIKTGLMQDLLTRGIDEHGNLRSEQTHEFKDSPLGRIPVEWDAVKIDQLASRVGSGVTPTGGESVYTPEGVLFIRSQNVRFDGLRLDDVAYIPERIHRSMLRSEVFENDVLLNITGASIGRCCRMPQGYGSANVNQHVCAIRLRDATEARSGHLAAVLESHTGQHQIAQLNAGGNRDGLNYQQVRSFVVPWPSEDAEFGRIFAGIQHAADGLNAYQASLSKLRLLKAGLMQDLLTGDRRVTALLGSPKQAVGA
jgi:type I restriction enzyme S subunit